MVKYHADIDRLEVNKKGDWIDLRCAEDVRMEKGDFKIISLGVSIDLPHGYEALVVPRSSTYKNYGIIMANSMGVIDEAYCGDDDIWGFPAIACRDTHIPFNARIAQFRLVWHQPGILIEGVEHLTNQNRGGFGSTGKF